MQKQDLETPELLVDLKVLKSNISKMQKLADNAGVHLRPMIKTHKSVEIAKMQLDAGCHGINVATVDEAEVMADAGIEDIFLTTEMVGEKKIERLMDLVERVKMSVAVDSVYGAEVLSRIAEKHGLKVVTILSIDVGNRRNGVLPREPALQLAKVVQKLKGVDLKGIYTHEGNVYSATNEKELRDLSTAAAKDMVDTANLLRSKGIPIEVVSIGSTPSPPYNASYPGVTEIRPGAYIFNDMCEILYGFCKLEDCAASLLLTIISKPTPDRMLCDAGTKEIFAPVEWMRFKDGGITLDWPNVEIGKLVDLDHKPLPGLNLEKLHEEYGFITVSKGAPEIKIGDKIEFIPYHVCPNINLWESITVIEDGKFKARWPISARGKCR